MKRQNIRRRAMWLALAAAGAMPTAAYAVNRFWVNGVTNGNWNSTSNWSTALNGAGGASVPTTGDVAVIQQNDATNRNITLNISATVMGVEITNTGGGTNTFTQSGSLNLTADFEWVGLAGVNGRGVHAQDSGVATFNNFLSLARLLGSFGTYNLSGSGSVLVQAGPTAFMTIGEGGTGIFNQSGGVVAVGTAPAPRVLELGFGNGSSGTYNLSGTGSLTVNGTETIGYNNGGVGSATGAFVQTGGSHTAGTLQLGRFNGSIGTYNLSAGSLASTVQEFVGFSASTGTTSATFTHSGGTHTAVDLYVGRSNTTGISTGTYLLSGTGSLTVTGTEHLGFNVSGSQATRAIFTQTGGTHTAGDLNIGQSPGTIAGYTLSGGSLTVNDDEAIGGSGGSMGTFQHSAGTHSVGGTLQINTNFGGTPSSYNLSGTARLTVAESVVISGVVTQSGGTHTVGSGGALEGLVIGSVDNGYTMSGGSLTVNGYEIILGLPGTGFVHTGGTHVVGLPGDPTELSIAPIAVTDGTYTLSAAGSLTVNGIVSVGGAGGRVAAFGDVLPPGPGGAGVFNINGGSMTVTEALSIWDTTGTAVNLSGGVVSAGALADAGSRLNWTGGTLTITDPAGLTIGPASSLPHLTMGGSATLNATAIAIPSGGTLTVNGGVVNYSTALTLSGGTIDGSAAFNNAAQITGYGTIGGSGGFSNSGGVTVNSGVLTLSKTGALSNAGTMTLSPGTQLQLTGGNLANTGVINISGATIGGTATLNNNAGGVVAGYGTLSAPVANNAGGTLIVQTGTISGSPITNNGIIRGDGLITSTLTNAATGEIRGESGKWLTINAMSAANNGKVNLLDGTVEFNAALTNSASGLITGRGGLRANAGLINNGQIQLIAGISDVTGTLTGNSGSKVNVTGNATATFYNNVTMNSGSEFHVSTGSTAVFLAPVTGASFFTGGGVKDFEAGSSIVGQLITAGGSTMVENVASLTATVIRENSLEAGGVVTIAPDGSNAVTSRLVHLTVLDGGKLNLTNNKLVLSGEDVGAWNGSTYTGVTGLIRNGRNGSTLPLWDGSGITTNQSSATAGNFTSIAVARASEARPASATATVLWGGQVVTGTDVLVMYTYGGDANLDGKLNIDDYVKIDQGIAGGYTGWVNGDFNYDGKVSIDDYITVIDLNIDNQSGVFPTSSGGPASAGPVVAVPEPGIGLLLPAITMTASFLHTRRRRFSL